MLGMQAPILNVQIGDDKTTIDGEFTTTITYDQLRRCRCSVATFVHHRDYESSYQSRNFTPFNQLIAPD